MTAAEKLSVYFEPLEDPRSDRNQKHPFMSIITISLLGAISGITSYSGLGEYALAYEEELEKIIPLPNGAPSHDTFQRFFEALDIEVFHLCFVMFTQHLKKVSSQLVAIDGKTIRNSGKDRPLHLVSAWCENNQLVLGQVKVDKKSNEITAIPMLLEMLDLTDATISIDAIGCQRSIAQRIVNSGNHYLLALKANQKSLLEDVTPYFDDLEKFEGSVWQEYDKGHGRIEKRTAYVLGDVRWLQKEHNWPGLRSVALVVSERTVKNKKTIETRYYLSSHDAEAELICRLARQHWGIENKLHWRLDVVYNEDKACIRNERGAENVALLRKWALNCLSPHKTASISMRSMQRRSSMSWKYLTGLLQKIFHA